jgi:hypothetical protein
MNYKECLYDDALKLIDKIYRESMYHEDIDLFRIPDIINAVNKNQIQSKEWLINEIKPFLPSTIENIYIAGAWYGVLGIMLRQIIDNKPLITMCDIDPGCEKIGLALCDHELYKHNYFRTDDVVDDYLNTFDNYDVLINTSCEHMTKADIRLMLGVKKKNTLVCLQSNNYHDVDSHINTSNSLEEFLEYINLNEILYSGIKPTDKYDRYMVIGK